MDDFSSDLEPIVISSSQDEEPEDVRISQSLAPIPHPRIWYNYQGTHISFCPQIKMCSIVKITLPRQNQTLESV